MVGMLLTPLDVTGSHRAAVDNIPQSLRLSSSIYALGYSLHPVPSPLPLPMSLLLPLPLPLTRCGRLFEGTPAQMWTSMQKLLALPDDTKVHFP